MGADNGSISCYINDGSSFSVNTSYFGSIDVGYASAPAFADIDGDGDEDLLIGSETGSNYVFLVREGNNFMTTVSNPFASIAFPNYSRPSFADIDNDSDYDLILGKSFGELNCYENVGNSQNPQWSRNDGLVSDVEVKQNAAPGFVDLDNDGKIDCIIGEYDGNFSYFKNLFAPTSVENENDKTPDEFYLSQNYPNPFNPSTKISYRIPLSPPLIKGGIPIHRDGGFVSLKVYNVLGSEVATLMNEEKGPGVYEVSFDADRYHLSSGVYFYKLQTSDYSKTKKMIIVR